MWTRLCDTFADNLKIINAGARLGQHGPAQAITLYVVGLIWANRQASDGFLPAAVVKQFPQVTNPKRVAEALVKAHLWEAVKGGFRIHDYADWNFTAAEVHAKRVADRERKRVNGHKGGLARHGVR